jgi:hypothetical protein
MSTEKIREQVDMFRISAGGCQKVYELKEPYEVSEIKKSVETLLAPVHLLLTVVSN